MIEFVVLNIRDFLEKKNACVINQYIDVIEMFGCCCKQFTHVIGIAHIGLYDPAFTAGVCNGCAHFISGRFIGCIINDDLGPGIG